MVQDVSHRWGGGVGMWSATLTWIPMCGILFGLWRTAVETTFHTWRTKSLIFLLPEKRIEGTMNSDWAKVRVYKTIKLDQISFKDFIAIILYNFGISITNFNDPQMLPQMHNARQQCKFQECERKESTAYVRANNLKNTNLIGLTTCRGQEHVENWNPNGSKFNCSNRGKQICYVDRCSEEDFQNTHSFEPIASSTFFEVWSEEVKDGLEH